jgi:hypothetical protein
MEMVESFGFLSWRPAPFMMMRLEIAIWRRELRAFSCVTTRASASFEQRIERGHGI